MFRRNHGRLPVFPHKRESRALAELYWMPAFAGIRTAASADHTLCPPFGPSQSLGDLLEIGRLVGVAAAPARG